LAIEVRSLGVIKGGGLALGHGSIMVGKRCDKFQTVDQAGRGKDQTLFATVDVAVLFKSGYKGRTYVNIVPS